MTSAGRKHILEYLCLIPVTVLVGIELYVRNFDGWGAWSAAPLFLIPIILSIVISGMAVFEYFIEARAGMFRKSLLVSIFISLIPLAWVLIRRHIL